MPCLTGTPLLYVGIMSYEKNVLLFRISPNNGENTFMLIYRLGFFFMSMNRESRDVMVALILS